MIFRLIKDIIWRSLMLCEVLSDTFHLHIIISLLPQICCHSLSISQDVFGDQHATLLITTSFLAGKFQVLNRKKEIINKKYQTLASKCALNKLVDVTADT